MANSEGNRVELAREIERLVAANRLQEAIDKLREIPDYKQAANSLGGRLKRVQGQQREGQLTQADIGANLNRIADAILASAQEISEGLVKEPPPPPENETSIRRTILGIPYVIMIPAIITIGVILVVAGLKICQFLFESIKPPEVAPGATSAPTTPPPDTFTPTPTNTLTPTPSPTNTLTPTPSPTNTFTPTPSPTPTLMTPSAVQTWTHDVSLIGSRQIYHLRLTGPAEIRARAQWTGTQSALALIINGPGQVNFYAREDGTSPLEVVYTVTESDFQSGDHWRVTIASFGEGQADGTVELRYPSGSSTTPLFDQFVVLKDGTRSRSLIVLNGPGTIQAQATWTGTPSNLALIINGPGQVGFYARRDDRSPLATSYDVTASDLASGDTWRVTLASFGSANAEGSINLTYP